jgi:4-hydroxy-3-polyprenylbenzoate decarboxylase
MSYPQRMIVALSGATGILYGIRILQALQHLNIESHLIMTRTAEITLAYESDLKVADVRAMADHSYRIDDLAAAPASGSFRSMGMVVAPCSVRCLAEIATGIGANLLTRSADVCLKERRRVVLMVRETPLHLGHIRNMATATEMGAIIAPPAPAFYTRPQTLDDIINHSVGRVLDLFDLDTGLVSRWGEPDGSGPSPYS